MTMTASLSFSWNSVTLPVLPVNFFVWELTTLLMIRESNRLC